jgi:hypothetical protein
MFAAAALVKVWSAVLKLPARALVALQQYSVRTLPNRGTACIAALL